MISSLNKLKKILFFNILNELDNNFFLLLIRIKNEIIINNAMNIFENILKKKNKENCEKNDNIKVF